MPISSKTLFTAGLTFTLTLACFVDFPLLGPSSLHAQTKDQAPPATAQTPKKIDLKTNSKTSPKTADKTPLKIATIDGSDKQVSTPFARKTIKILESRFPGENLVFRNLKLHTSPDGKQSFCGEMSISPDNPPDDDSFVPFGAQKGGDESQDDSPIVYDPEDIPESLDLQQEDKYINRGADLENLEELGCVPEGTYRHYSDRLTEIIQHRRASMIR